MDARAGQRYAAEFLGTLGLLVFGGGAAVLTLNGPGGDPRIVLVSFAFGLTVMAGAYAFGELSGAHFNPAVTLSMALAGKMPRRDVIPYLLAQVLGALVGISIVLGIVAGSSSALSAARGAALASQCYSAPGAPAGCGFSLGSVFLIEFIATFLFVFVIHALTRPDSAAKNLAPLGIGLTLAVTNLMAIPVDGASINPARSFAPALLSYFWPGAGWALQESWVFWVAPILGGLLAAGVSRLFERAK